MSSLIVIPVVLIVGFMADRIRYGITIPLCISFSGGFLYLQQLSDSPSGALTYIGEIGANAFFVSSISLVNSLMGKCVPLENKGTLLGIFCFFGSLGSLACSKAGGELFDINANLPFICIAVLSWTYALVICILTLCGKFTQ